MRIIQKEKCMAQENSLDLIGTKGLKIISKPNSKIKHSIHHKPY